jgi:hypothetical protein
MNQKFGIFSDDLKLSVERKGGFYNERGSVAAINSTVM